MEGLRGVAVSLVFLQHYAMQWVSLPPMNINLPFWRAVASYGNQGVELFFVLSGFLIYGALIRRRPSFLKFMARRAERLYPAFLVALLLALVADFATHGGKMPSGIGPTSGYLLSNVLFLPGLFPITPLLTVSWSLSYEVFFYVVTAIAVLIASLYAWRPRYRVALLITVTASFVVTSWMTDDFPFRMLPLLFGMLLLEAYRAGHRIPWVVGGVAVAAPIIAFLVLDLAAAPAPAIVREAAYALGFTLLCGSVLGARNPLSAVLSWEPLRWLGNMSYSYYLVHAFVVVIAIKIARSLGVDAPWLFLPVAFALTLIPAALLFIAIERPLSLRPKRWRAQAAPATSITPPAEA